MKAWDFDCVAYDADHYCVECLPNGVDAESDDVMPVFASNEVDSYPVCCVCGAEHDYMGLTTDGKEGNMMIEAANNDRLHELIMDALRRKREFASNGNERLAAYWQGKADGLREARRVFGALPGDE
jgi:hypothetical protein